MTDRKSQLADSETGDQPQDYKLTPAELTAFRKHVAELNRLIAVIRTRIPEAGYYLACGGGSGTLCILSGDSHEGVEARACQDRILYDLTLDTSDGGDW